MTAARKMHTSDYLSMLADLAEYRRIYRYDPEPARKWLREQDRGTQEQRAVAWNLLRLVEPWVIRPPALLFVEDVLQIAWNRHCYADIEVHPDGSIDMTILGPKPDYNATYATEGHKDRDLPHEAVIHLGLSQMTDDLEERRAQQAAVVAMFSRGEK